MDCAAGGRMVQAATVDEPVGQLVERLELPEGWRERLEELANHREERVQMEQKRRHVEDQLRRLRDLYVNGDFRRREYDRRKSELQSKLTVLRPPDPPDVEGAGEVLESLGAEWSNAPLRFQRDKLQVIFEAVYVDVLARKLVCVKPYPPFVPLFRMDGLEEREDGCFYCEEDEEARSED